MTKEKTGETGAGSRNILADFCAHFGFDITPWISEVRFEGGEEILCEGERPDFLYYLTEGRAKHYISREDGQVSLLTFLYAPCFIGEMELLGARRTADGVTALTPCRGYAIRAHDCREKLLSDAKFLRELCMSLSDRAVRNTEIYSRNQSCPLRARLADFILAASPNGIYRERHTEVSEFLGVSYRHLLYVLADFVKRGMLEKQPSGYYIRDEAALRAAAKGADLQGPPAEKGHRKSKIS